MRQRIKAGRIRFVRNVLTLALAILAMTAAPSTLWAHPMGNFTVNRYSRLELGPRQIHLLYVIDMAEIPTQQEMAVLDRNRDGERSEEEVARYLDEMVATIAANAHLFLNEKHTVWQPIDQQIEFPPGQADLPTLRLTVRLAADLPAGELWDAEYFDDNFTDRLGWREVVVQAAPGARLLESSAPQQDVSQALRNYPEDLLQSPPALTGATFRFAPAVAGQASGGAAAGAAQQRPAGATNGVGKPNDRFAELITLPALGPGALVLALLAAFGWGALHALSPGHGKTIVAAYLVGTRGTVRHALFLGVTTTITHTIGVFAIGFVTLFLSKYILPETLYPWLGVLSGLLVVAMGLSLVRGRIGELIGGTSHGHDHAHTHDHNWSFPHDHSHGHAPGHSHLPSSGDGRPVTWRGLITLGVSGGLVPCPSALVLMLGAIAVDRIAFGLALILIFSIGLATVLTAIGTMLVYASQWFERIPESNRLLRVMPVASAAFITIIGAGIAWQALVQTGLLGFG
jgi:nickel/cobalt exporter